MRERSLHIRTPEGIVFTLSLAGPVSRFLAWLLDVLIVSAASMVLGMALGPFVLISPDLTGALSLLCFFALSIGYGMATEWYWRGQTVGKRVLRLRVVDEAGLALRPSQVVLRNLLRAVDALPMLYLLGGVVLLLGRYGQRLGDLAASTVVVHTPRRELPDLEPLEGMKYNALREQPHLEARLAQRLSPAEASLALRSLQRRNQLTPEARVELFRRLADHFRARVVFPEAAVEHLADEQYVRNVVDVVYRPARTGNEGS